MSHCRRAHSGRAEIADVLGAELHRRAPRLAERERAAHVAAEAVLRHARARRARRRTPTGAAAAGPGRSRSAAVQRRSDASGADISGVLTAISPKPKPISWSVAQQADGCRRARRARSDRRDRSDCRSRERSTSSETSSTRPSRRSRSMLLEAIVERRIDVHDVRRVRRREVRDLGARRVGAADVVLDARRGRRRQRRVPAAGRRALERARRATPARRSRASAPMSVSAYGASIIASSSIGSPAALVGRRDVHDERVRRRHRRARLRGASRSRSDERSLLHRASPIEVHGEATRHAGVVEQRA